MPIKKPQLVIFDMDGTMFDTEMLSIKGWEAAVAAQIPGIPWEEFSQVFYSMLGRNLANCRQISNELMPEFDFDKGNEDSFIYMDNYMKTHGVPIKPGLFELLDALEELNIKKCVATSTAKDRATQKLEMANIAHRFEVIVGGDEVVISKPNPEIFLKAAKACGVAPENCLVLEDSAAGVEAGYKAGMEVIVIPDLVQPTQETCDMANEKCKDLFEVAGLLV